MARLMLTDMESSTNERMSNLQRANLKLMLTLIHGKAKPAIEANVWILAG